jgi:hypothetical protein
MNMKNKIFGSIKLLSSSIVLALAVSGSATAVDIKYATFSDLNGVFTGSGPNIAQLASDGSGLTSAFVDPNNINQVPFTVPNGYFVETFDKVQAPDGAENEEFNVVGQSDNCAVNSIGVTLTESQGGVANVRRGSTSKVAAAPLNDDTCYAYTTPGADSSIPSYVDIDYTDFLAAATLASPNPNGVFINYLGFYMGSVDTYNEFEFYKSSDMNPLATIDGSDILNALSGSSGNQTSELSNVWIELSFSAGEAFDRLRIISTGIAGEFDNITIGLNNRPQTPVPAPTGLAILGLGLLGLGLRKRYSK